MGAVLVWSLRVENVLLIARSYLVYPVIRAARQISVRGAVLIFDEAHNIEDVARRAGIKPYHDVSGRMLCRRTFACCFRLAPPSVCQSHSSPR